MPLSTRRSARKRSATNRNRGDLDSSPSRPATKKRKTDGVVSPSPRPRVQEEPPMPSDDSSDETNSEAEIQTLADAVIPHLTVARAPVNVAHQHDNFLKEGQRRAVPAYAKLCGRNWTYYVVRLNITIGRPPDGTSRQSPGIGAESSPPPQDGATAVDIDLGPSKTVSRSHAELFYDFKVARWYVSINGRNGLRINEKEHRAREQLPVGSGDVLEIAGTQMMFVTAQEKAVIHPMFTAKLGETEFGDTSAEWADLRHAQHEQAPIERAQRSSSQTQTKTQANGQTPIASAPPGALRPTTPEGKAVRASSAVKQSPAYGRGIMLESTQHIDYASDVTRDLKPTIGYAAMITQAILSRPEESITLNDIYTWIEQHFSFYRHLTTNWKNSIRHNLSLNSAFEKIPRQSNEPGKGMKWRMKPEKRAEMIANVAKAMKKNHALPPSAPASPTDKEGPFEGHSAHTQPPLSETNGIKTSPTATSPLITTYPTAQESYTPSRGPRIAAESSQSLPVLSDDPSPLPRNRHNGIANALGSSPFLPSGWADTNQLRTPAPRPHNLNNLQPNTAKLPTSHMADSSPAPFWRFEPGSVVAPANWPAEISPLKTANLQSSSPPPGLANGNESPTRSRGLPPTNPVSEMDDDGAIDLTKGFQPIGSFHHQRSTGVNSNAVR